ncbi:MAG: DUF6489 family protein [Pseudomonadales bacterium]|jgi:hypothetical protein|nr:DUF6489 family protein [Pseudomonadales bacterium]
MKLNVELELSPEELRRLLGLPDVAPVNDMLVERLRDQMEKGLDGTLLRNLVQSMIKGGTQGIEVYQSLLGSLFRGAKVRTPGESAAARDPAGRSPGTPASEPGTPPYAVDLAASARGPAAEPAAPPAPDAAPVPPRAGPAPEPAAHPDAAAPAPRAPAQGANTGSGNR